MVTSPRDRMRPKVTRLQPAMLCCGRKKGGRDGTPDLATSPRRQPNAKQPPPMVIQPDFRKVSGISSEIFKQIESVENDGAGDSSMLEAVERRGEMLVHMLDPKQLGAAAMQAARPWLSAHHDSKRPVHLVEIVKRPGQTLGLYIREGNGMERQDGVFISRIALESSVYNSGCLKVGDEILAVNFVDVTRMSLDDVVIIMSIPRRLVLVTREGTPCSAVGLQSQPLHKPLPVVVIKAHQTHLNSREASPSPLTQSESSGGTSRLHASRSHLALGLDHHQPQPTQEHRMDHQTSYYTKSHTLERMDRSSSWLYQPPAPPVVTEQPKPHHHHTSPLQHYQTNQPPPYDKTYPKTLESLAEKVHSFYPGGSCTQPRRMSATTSSGILSYYGGGTARSKLMPRSGSDQHLPRVEYSDYSRESSYTRTRAGLAGAPASAYASLTRRQRPIDYSSDTEASRPSYYYYRQHQPSTNTGVSGLDTPGSRLSGLRSNSLPRDTRQPRHHVPTLPTHRSSTLRLERESSSLLPSTVASLMDQEDDGALSAPEMTLSRKHRGRLVSSPSVFTADEYRAWLTRAPSSSAIYSRGFLAQQKAQRFTFSAENLPQRTRQSELVYSTYRPGQLAAMGPVKSLLERGAPERQSLTSRSASLRRMHNLLELEAKSLGKGASDKPLSRHSSQPLLQINPAEFLKYKQSVVRSSQAEVSGLLWLHLLSGRGLRATNPPSNTPTIGSSGVRDLYCVLECDGVHKARTVVRTADLIFDWDETFELDLVSNRELDFLIYSWDPQYRHKLCYKGSVQLGALLQESPVHHLAVKIEPRGTLYLRLHHTSPHQTFLRKPKQPIVPRGKPLSGGVFGIELETVVTRESMSSDLLKGDTVSLPVIVRRCVEEVERRGLDIIGLYRLCGSATKKRILREAFERNPRTVDLSPDNVPDINVITGVLKDYLRELPEPLVTKCLFQMLQDAVSVCLPDDPQGNASLIFSILDCLPPVNRSTLVFLMNHLALVSSQTERNKMSTQSLAVCFAPVLILHSESEEKPLDFQAPISVIRYLLDIWPLKSERAPVPPPRKSGQEAPPPLPAKPSGAPPRPKPTVIASPVSNTSSSSEGEETDGAGYQAFDSKANFDSKKSVFEKAVSSAGPPPPGGQATPLVAAAMKAAPSPPPRPPTKPEQPRPYRNNPFADDMEPATPTSSDEPSRQPDSDDEEDDDSINLK